jgi:hypothetical protein
MLMLASRITQTSFKLPVPRLAHDLEERLMRLCQSGNCTLFSPFSPVMGYC